MELGLFARKMSLTILFAFSKYLGTIHGFGRTVSQQCYEFFRNTCRAQSHRWLKHFGQGWAKLCPGKPGLSAAISVPALLLLSFGHISMIQSHELGLWCRRQTEYNLNYNIIIPVGDFCHFFCILDYGWNLSKLFSSRKDTFFHGPDIFLYLKWHSCPAVWLLWNGFQ